MYEPVDIPIHNTYIETFSQNKIAIYMCFKFDIINISKYHPSAMFAQLSLLHFIILLLPTTLSLSISKPGCPDLCGNLSIPFPFGVGSDCSLDNSFNINCNTSTYPPKPFLSIINAEIVEINQTYIRVMYPNLVSVCYGGGAGINVTAPSYKHSVSMNLSGTSFTLSSSNRLMAIGCDDMMLGFNEPDGVSMFVGCSAFCKSDRGGVGYCTNNRTSRGTGCCDAPIDRVTYTGFLGAQLIDMSGKLLRKRLYSCSYAFIKEWKDDLNGTDVFSYPWYYLDNSTALVNDNWASATDAPVVRLDWTIINADNCSQANMCVAKSVCVDPYYYFDRGYLCSCVNGYEGNPYLPGGCKPISGLTPVAKIECPDQCGNLSIPFPFGVGENCYLAPSFNIRCNTSSENSPKAYLVELDAEVIAFSSSQVFVRYPNLGFACYNLSYNQHRVTKTDERRLILDLSRTQYSLSDENWIAVVGCHDMLEGVYGPANRSFMDSSCAAVCRDEEYYGSCWANGCCRTDIPRGTTYLEAKLTDLSEQWPRTNFSCSYTFVEYKFDTSSQYVIMNNLTEIQHDVESTKTLVLDWRIGAVNCKEAQRNPDYACKTNSYCVDFDATVGGYLCNCSKGYVGNPYINSGCKDIDECHDEATNPCVSNSVCNNTPGSVICPCPKGYNGDGRKDGNGCIHEQQTKIIILIGMSSGLGFLLLLLMCFWLYKVLQKRKEKSLKAKFFKRNGGLLLRQQTNEGTLGTTKVFSANELEIATDYFNGNRIIGHGGQGTVYKGILFDGKIVAIKKSKLVEENQLKLFINEVVILSQINHRNVVKLLGCCLETEVPMLVYEFMPNGTLFDLIHDPTNEFPFPWNLRLKIAADIAGALAYLHSASSIPIYHRDIKSENILLDEKYVVKVSDFGISRSIVADQTHLTTMVKGTFGYLDPEYFQSSQFTEKSDVYSFGVVLVELITGQRPISLDKTNEERGLAPRFRTSMEENCLDTLLDPQVLEQSKKEEVIVVARLAQRCLNLRGKMRPTMKEVATALETCRISEMSCTVDDEFEEVRIFEDMESISDDGYTWTSNYKGASTSSSNTHPLTSTKERTTII